VADGRLIAAPANGVKLNSCRLRLMRFRKKAVICFRGWFGHKAYDENANRVLLDLTMEEEDEDALFCLHSG
jgi:hypothetical protein